MIVTGDGRKKKYKNKEAQLKLYCAGESSADADHRRHPVPTAHNYDASHPHSWDFLHASAFALKCSSRCVLSFGMLFASHPHWLHVSGFLRSFLYDSSIAWDRAIVPFLLILSIAVESSTKNEVVNEFQCFLFLRVTAQKSCEMTCKWSCLWASNDRKKGGVRFILVIQHINLSLLQNGVWWTIDRRITHKRLGTMWNPILYSRNGMSFVSVLSLHDVKFVNMWLRQCPTSICHTIYQIRTSPEANLRVPATQGEYSALTRLTNLKVCRPWLEESRACALWPSKRTS